MFVYDHLCREGTVSKKTCFKNGLTSVPYKIIVLCLLCELMEHGGGGYSRVVRQYLQPVHHWQMSSDLYALYLYRIFPMSHLSPSDQK